ncbi:MAG: C cytochrome precursor [Planctomycetes bacterium]|nr:C cytochrome precursor [Planctomycetota bacterium]
MFEIVVFLLVLCVGTLPLVLHFTRGRALTRRAAVLGLWLVGGAALTWAASRTQDPAPVLDRPIEVNSQDYVSSNACRACHPGEYDSWYGSYHRTMTQPATVATVAGPLAGGVRVHARGQDFELEARGEEVWVTMNDPAAPADVVDVPRIERRVVMTTGSHEEQFFWTSMGGRKLSLLPVMYRLDPDEQRWAPLDGCCISPPTSVQEGENARWNRVCNRCHSTHASPRISEDDTVMDTHAVELGIACEACHGPGTEHVAANRDPRRRYDLHADEGGDATIVNPERLDHVRSSMACAQCHSTAGFLDNDEYYKWKQQGYTYRPGEDLFATRSLYTEGDDKFWKDGMVRVSGREFSGMHRAPCYTDGEMSCLSCHQLHMQADDPRPFAEWANDMLKPGMDGDRACTQCHEEYLDDDVRAQHTHHPLGSSGSECLNCHMPYVTYGLLKGIRTHEVCSPSARESVAYGRPNACNQCHLDETLLWTAQHLDEWYGIEPPQLTPDQRTVAASVLWTLRGNSGQRVLMAWSFGWDAARATSGTDWMTPYLLTLMRDPYHATRYIAARSFQKQPEAHAIDYDFMLPSDQLQPRTMPAYAAWAQHGAERPARAATLISATGELDLPEYDRHLGQRDNTSVTLNE